MWINAFDLTLTVLFLADNTIKST